MHDLTLSLLGGVIIGGAAAGLMLFKGRIAGISGIYSGLLTPKPSDTAWRVAFVLGLILGGLALRVIHPAALQDTLLRPLWVVALGGLLVGIGVRFGSGCTSGHGICGLGRLSRRSIVATLSFTLSGMAAATLYAWIGG
ncbi:YeeE/YedE family protein [Myxococcota bacterium]|nr:YeeE/YedE family protein [Myxococcota bacterium]MBU1431112.1 YeeE/YedE family protein [Myxococcota bacterium]MBU1897108.1 YeeE/YedE family protein [Myxococcota bacterium]